MKDFALLLKLNFKNYFAKNPNSKSQQKASRIAILVLYLIFEALFCTGLYFIGRPIAESGEGAYLISTILMASQFVALMYGIFTTLNTLYFSHDNEFLSALPLRPTSIFMSKFAVLYLLNLALSSAVLAPMLLIFGIASGAAYYYYLLMIPAMIFTPMIPIIIISLLSMPIIYIARLFKRSSIASLIAMIVGYLAIMGAYFGLVFSIQSSVSAEGGVDSIIAPVTNILKITGQIIFPNLFITRAMTGNDVAMNLPIYLLIMLAAGAAALIIAKLFYKKIIIMANSNIEVKHKAKRRIKQLPTVATLMKYDMLSLSRQPGLMFYSITGLLCVPIISIFLLIGGSTPVTSLMMPLLGITMNYIAITAVSREREKFFITKYLPVSARDFVLSKLILSTVYVAVFTIISFIMFIAATGVLIESLLCTAIVLFAGLAVSAYAITADMKKPQLNWNSLKELNNKNAVLILGTIFGGMLISVGGTMFQAKFGQLALNLMLLVIALVFAAGAGFLHYRLIKNAEPYYNAINATNG